MAVPESVYVLRGRYAPHDWLFPQCAAVVHHGGAGVPLSFPPCIFVDVHGQIRHSSRVTALQEDSQCDVHVAACSNPAFWLELCEMSHAITEDVQGAVSMHMQAQQVQALQQGAPR